MGMMGCGHHGWPMGEMEAGHHPCQKTMGPKMILKHAMKKAMVMALAERIKPRLEQRMGAQLDQMADLVVEMMMKKREAKLGLLKQKMEMKERMQEILFGEEEDEEEED